MPNLLILLTAAALTPLALKCGFIILCMLLARRRASGAPAPLPVAPPRLAFLVPAHNEEGVVGPCVGAIRAQDYPPERIAVFVVADNCSDGTASAAREAGAEVFERSTKEISGKAKAVRHGLEQIAASGAAYDHLVIVDADNVLAADWARTVAARLQPGDDGFQTYVETKNPHDSRVTFGNYLAFVFMNRVIQQGRSRLGLPALLAGTGMGFSRAFLDQQGFASESLTEDRDLSLQALVRGYRFRWIGEAVLFDEKPVAAQASFKQSKRWSSGQLAGLRAELKGLSQLARRGRWVRALDLAYTIVGPVLPPTFCLALLLGVAGAVVGDLRPLAGALGLATLAIVLLAAVVFFFGRGLKDVARLGSYLYLRLIAWASLLAALFKKDQRWTKTRHERHQTSAELERIRRGNF